MIDRVELTRKMQERVLGLGEILKASFQLLFERFGFFFLLRPNKNPILITPFLFKFIQYIKPFGSRTNYSLMV